MKTRIILIFISLCALSGCANLGAFSNSPETAAIIGAVTGGVIDKGLLGGNGKVGAIAGATLGYAAGAERANNLRTERLAMGSTRCSNTQRGHYEQGVFVITSDNRACTSDIANAGWRSHPDERMSNLPIRYQTGAPVSVPGSSGATSCRRYNADGTINPDC